LAIVDQRAFAHAQKREAIQPGKIPRGAVHNSTADPSTTFPVLHRFIPRLSSLIHSECTEVGWVEKEGFVGLVGDFAEWF